MIMKSDINKLVWLLFVHLSSIILDNFKDRTLIIPEILELIELHTYRFGLVLVYRGIFRCSRTTISVVCGPIWPKLEQIQGNMHSLVIGKF